MAVVLALAAGCLLALWGRNRRDDAGFDSKHARFRR
jgi:hypothetical protein